MLKLFGLRKCTTCQKTMDYLDKKKKTYDLTDVKDDRPSKEQVTKWSKAVGGWEKLINRAGYTWRGLAAADTKNLTEAKAVTLAVDNPSLIRRPLIEHPDGSVTVGFSDKVKGFIG
jgi:Spx/MgsR family transcriptional regulator